MEKDQNIRNSEYAMEKARDEAAISMAGSAERYGYLMETEFGRQKILIEAENIAQAFDIAKECGLENLSMVHHSSIPILPNDLHHLRENETGE